MKNVLVNFSFISVQDLNNLNLENRVDLSDFERYELTHYDPENTKVCVPYDSFDKVSDHSIYLVYDNTNPLYISIFNSLCFMKDILDDLIKGEEDNTITLSGNLDEALNFQLLPECLRVIINSLFSYDNKYILSI